MRKAKEKRKDIPTGMQSSKEQEGEIRKPSSVISAKKQRKTVEWERLENSRKLEIPRELFMQSWAHLLGPPKQKQKILRRSGKNTQRNYIKKSS